MVYPMVNELLYWVNGISHGIFFPPFGSRSHFWTPRNERTKRRRARRVQRGPLRRAARRGAGGMPVKMVIEWKMIIMVSGAIIMVFIVIHSG